LTLAAWRLRSFVDAADGAVGGGNPLPSCFLFLVGHQIAIKEILSAALEMRKLDK
jgi:hypothetical protein